MDGYIPSTKVIIEQKSNGIDLFKAEDRPNGLHHEKITPFQQGMRYNNHLSAKEKAYYIDCCCNCYCSGIICDRMSDYVLFYIHRTDVWYYGGT